MVGMWACMGVRTFDRVAAGPLPSMSMQHTARAGRPCTLYARRSSCRCFSSRASFSARFCACRGGAREGQRGSAQACGAHQNAAAD